MLIQTHQIAAAGIKIIITENGQKIGRAFLYLMKNDLHAEPFGFMEDVFVEEQFRGQGYGEKLAGEVVAEAKKQGCYKLICTSRFSNERAHHLYEKLGFRKHGNEFRMDF